MNLTKIGTCPGHIRKEGRNYILSKENEAYFYVKDIEFFFFF